LAAYLKVLARRSLLMVDCSPSLPVVRIQLSTKACSITFGFWKRLMDAVDAQIAGLAVAQLRATKQAGAMPLNGDDGVRPNSWSTASTSTEIWCSRATTANARRHQSASGTAGSSAPPSPIIENCALIHFLSGRASTCSHTFLAPVSIQRCSGLLPKCLVFVAADWSACLCTAHPMRV
jgi:hypothetical protein